MTITVGLMCQELLLCRARAAAGHQGAQCYTQTTASGIPTSFRELGRVQGRSGVRI